MELAFVLNLTPRPQKQTRFRRVGKFIQTYDASAKDLKNLRLLLQAFAPPIPMSGSIYIDATFYLPTPKSTSKKKKSLMESGEIAHNKKPDLDNLSYLLTNAMKGLIYQDDRQIIEVHERKKYGLEPRIEVLVKEI